MKPEKYKYSHYQIKRAMKDKVVHIGGSRYLVNEKHIVIDNQKNFRCDCQWFDDNKSHLRYCHCVLAVLHFLDKEAFWNDVFSHGIKKKKVINKKDEVKLTDEGL